MSKAAITDAVPQQDKDYENAVDRYMVELEHVRDEMAASQQRIKRLRAQTSEILSETRDVLAKLAA